MPINGGFWDLSAEDRGVIYDLAERETGYENFHDMPPEMRSQYYDRAAALLGRADDGWDD